jgi:adenine phosphoribosyltransferase
VDDVLATGGTAVAALNLIEKAGLSPITFAFVLEIAQLGGQSRIASDYPGLKIQILLTE